MRMIRKGVDCIGHSRTIFLTPRWGIQKNFRTIDGPSFSAKDSSFGENAHSDIAMNFLLVRERPVVSSYVGHR
jgi:hypothetical protein